MTPNKQGTEKCEYCNNNHTKDMTCKPLVDSVISPQGDTTEDVINTICSTRNGSMDDKQFMATVEYNIHKLLLQAKEQERQEIVDAIEKAKIPIGSVYEITPFKTGVNEKLNEIQSLITQRGTKSAEKEKES